MKNILLIITGSIAAVKAGTLIKLLLQQSYNVNVILTEAARQFVKQDEITCKCFASQDMDDYMLHIKLAREANLILIAPASANFIAKMAAGMADNLALMTLLASEAPVMVAPAMNTKMFEHLATQANINILRKRSVSIIDTEYGILACGEKGYGRMAEPQSIVNHVKAFFVKTMLLKGKKIVITLGNTQEKIDPVRYISNYSSGNLGVAIASEALKLGAEVVAITGHIKARLSDKVKRIDAFDAVSMYEQAKKHMPCDIFIAVAAVCDFKPINIAGSKIKKSNKLHIEFSKNIDVLANIAHDKTNRPKYVIGMALESDNIIDNARAKLVNKNADMIIANNANDINSDRKTYILITGQGINNLGIKTKQELAELLMTHIVDK